MAYDKFSTNIFNEHNGSWIGGYFYHFDVSAKLI